MNEIIRIHVLLPLHWNYFVAVAAVVGNINLEFVIEPVRSPHIVLKLGKLNFILK